MCFCYGFGRFSITIPWILDCFVVIFGLWSFCCVLEQLLLLCKLGTITFQITNASLRQRTINCFQHFSNRIFTLQLKEKIYYVLETKGKLLRVLFYFASPSPRTDLISTFFLLSFLCGAQE